MQKAESIPVHIRDAERRGRLLAYLTIIWNSLEGIIAVSAGVVAGSIALVGFGVDSVIEVSSGAIILWRLASGAERERIALKLVGVSFLALSAYVAFDAVRSLWFRKKAGSKWERHSFTLEPRSAYVLRGEAREQWEHSIPPVDALRYSITFRTLR